MKFYMRMTVGFALAVCLFYGGIALMRSGIYGWTLFVVYPIALGGIAEWVFQPSSARASAGDGVLMALGCAFLLFFAGVEGALCLVMALPLILPLGALGAWLVRRARFSRHAARGVTMLLLLPPGTLAWDATAQPPLYSVHTTITIAASSRQVWEQVIAFPQLREPNESYFRTGLAYPMRARIEGRGVGAVRYCEFSTGAFVEPIEVWEEPRVLRFRVTENPAPMQEWSPYGSIQAKHLHGYLISRQGEFRLTALPDGETLLEGTTRYQHGLWPAEYWRLWSDAIIHRIHMRVLNHIKTLAEGEANAEGGMRR